MKFGIMTFHNIPNIGAILQAYALCEFFRMKDQECYLVDYTCDNIWERELKFSYGRNIIKNIYRYYFFLKHGKKKIVSCQEFLKNRHMYSKKYYKCDDKLADDFDVFLSGSDMIWNLKFTKYDWSYYLDFLPENKPRYSYASSIGEEWQKSDLEKVRILLSRYRILTSREKDTCKVIEDELGVSCHWVPDPTILLPAEFWKKLVNTTQSGENVLVYFPNKGILNAAISYAKKNDLKVIVINNGIPIIKANVINKAVYNPVEWLQMINDAKAIFTDSYHGFLFSLYFKKPVWVNKEGNRFETLISELGLHKCRISEDENFENVIDYEYVDAVIKKFRKTGIEYIEKIICDANILTK